MKVNSFIQHLSEGLYDPGIFKAFFLAGGPGAGKTFVTSSAFSGSGLKVVNSDVAFERGLKKANLLEKIRSICPNYHFLTQFQSLFVNKRW